VHLDAADPLAGPTVAWQTLDAVVLDRAPTGDATQILLAGGTDIVVRADNVPDTVWPWRRDGAWWILDAAGRFAAVPSDSAYEAVAGWQPTLDVTIREQWVLVGVVVAILLMGLRLWKSKMAPYAALVLGAGVAILLMTLQRQDQAETGGQVLIDAPYMAEDDWTFVRGIHPSHDYIAWNADEVLAPVLPEHGSVQVDLEITGLGDPQRIGYRLGENQTLAFVAKSVDVGKMPMNLARNLDSPVRMIVYGSYPGGKIIGQEQVGVGLGPPVWIEASRPGRAR